jgi:hypothetical protein
VDGVKTAAATTAPTTTYFQIENICWELKSPVLPRRSCMTGTCTQARGNQPGSGAALQSRQPVLVHSNRWMEKQPVQPMDKERLDEGAAGKAHGAQFGSRSLAPIQVEKQVQTWAQNSSLQLKLKTRKTVHLWGQPVSSILLFDDHLALFPLKNLCG